MEQQLVWVFEVARNHFLSNKKGKCRLPVCTANNNRLSLHLKKKSGEGSDYLKIPLNMVDKSKSLQH